MIHQGPDLRAREERRSAPLLSTACVGGLAPLVFAARGQVLPLLHPHGGAPVPRGWRTRRHDDGRDCPWSRSRHGITNDSKLSRGSPPAHGCPRGIQGLSPSAAFERIGRSAARAH